MNQYGGYPPPPNGGFPPPMPPQPPQQPSNGLAIASLVCGIVGFFVWGPALLGLIFGIIAIRNGNTGGTAKAGLILSIICLVLEAGIIIACVACIACGGGLAILDELMWYL